MIVVQEPENNAAVPLPPTTIHKFELTIYCLKLINVFKNKKKKYF